MWRIRGDLNLNLYFDITDLKNREFKCVFRARQRNTSPGTTLGLGSPRS